MVAYLTGMFVLKFFFVAVSTLHCDIKVTGIALLLCLRCSHSTPGLSWALSEVFLNAMLYMFYYFLFFLPVTYHTCTSTVGYCSLLY